jgi:hypothetical protein
MRTMLLAISTITLTGCATLASGTHDTVRVVSDPAGASVQVGGRNVGVTPLEVAVSKKSPAVIAVHPSGCDRAQFGTSRRLNGWIWSNAALTYLGAATAVVDFLTGAAYSVRESEVGARCVNGETVPFHAVVVGMTANQVRQAWGDPMSVNHTRTAAGASEQWVYDLGRYVYVDNGVVTAVQATTSGR